MLSGGELRPSALDRNRTVQYGRYRPEGDIERSAEILTASCERILCMTDKDQVEQECLSSLVREAERDCVFLSHITTGRFGGEAYTSEELPLAVARVANALIKSGCKVGFRDPDAETWQLDTDLPRAENPGAAITARWLADPKDVEFLVLARRHS